MLIALVLSLAAFAGAPSLDKLVLPFNQTELTVVVHIGAHRTVEAQVREGWFSESTAGSCVATLYQATVSEVLQGTAKKDEVLTIRWPSCLTPDLRVLRESADLPYSPRPGDEMLLFLSVKDGVWLPGPAAYRNYHDVAVAVTNAALVTDGANIVTSNAYANRPGS